MNGNWRGQDRFCLMTDALAQWFLRQCDEDKEPWKVVDRLLAESDADPVFGAWVEELRDRQEIRNDDVTLLVVDL
jgi:predicted hydrolase (HD superfamily)